MPLVSGQKLAHYEVLDALGAGGMGEVYRARDTKLGREVAIKILPEHVSSPDRIERFEREARLLASLTHPNVAVLHGLESSDGQRFLVMELVEGETLAARIGRGPLSVDDALPIFCQIAAGVAAAHAKGIIHRDLKPANVMLTGDGVPKVLDFGLAKAFGVAAPEASSSSSPTMTREGETGVLVGTAAYMSPEQAQGKPLDKRTDAWSFGCCLFEALTGRSLFGADTVTATLANVLKQEPDWEALPDDTPERVHRVLRRCLSRNPDKRFRDLDDVRVELEEDVVERDESRPRKSAPSLGLVAGLLLGGAVFGAILREVVVEPDPPSAPVIFELAPMPESVFRLTRDGNAVLYVDWEGEPGASEWHLNVRTLDSDESRTLAGTEGVREILLSPDGEWIGVLSNDELERTQLDGGLPTRLADVSEVSLAGGTWSSNGNIYIGTLGDGLYTVPEAGGELERLTETKDGEVGHRYPEATPNGAFVLFTVWRGASETSSIDALNVETGERVTLVEGATRPVLSSSGHLLYAREPQLFAVRFNLDRGLVDGPEVGLLENIRVGGYGGFRGGYAEVALSDTGTLLYQTERGGLPTGRLVLVDRGGEARPLVDIQRFYLSPRVSPGGDHVAVAVVDERSRSPLNPRASDIWIVDVRTGSMNRLTSEGRNGFLVWSPDGTHVAAVSDRMATGVFSLFTLPLDPGETRQLTTETVVPTDWPRGRNEILAMSFGPNQDDIVRINLGDVDEPRSVSELELLYGNPLHDGAASVSPDGTLLAYSSAELGSPHVYVTSYPELRGTTTVSRGGGQGPRWSRDGRELFYRRDGGMYAVSIRREPELQIGEPDLLFELAYNQGFDRWGNYDVLPDGQHFVMFRPEEGEYSSIETHVILNFHTMLEERVPRSR